jgi:predicted nuclease of predicted toxin-antitoxin system
MKLLFDQNISHKVINYLPDYFASSSCVKTEGLINAKDKEIWEFAKINGFTIVTQDSDFIDLSALFGFPPKIIWFRTGNLQTKEIAHLLELYVEDISTFIMNKNHSCFEIYKM